MRTLAAGLALGLLFIATDPAKSCSLALGTPGLLALNATGDRLASDTLPGAPATATVIVPILQGVQIEVGAPARTQTPGGYNAAAEIIEVSYVASALLGQVAAQPYTTTTTIFPASAGLAALAVWLTLNNRITNPRGFPGGTYMTRTVITCHP